MKTDGGRGGFAAVCNAGMHNPKTGCTIFASPASASHCITVHIIVSQCIALHHSASHCNTVHLFTTQYILCLSFLCLTFLCTKQRQAALAAWAGCTGCRRAEVDEVAFVLCAPGHFDGSGEFVFIMIKA